MNPNDPNGIDLNKAVQGATEITGGGEQPTTPPESQEPPTGPDWSDAPYVLSDTLEVTATEPAQEAEQQPAPQADSGMGIVIENKQEAPAPRTITTGLPPELAEGVKGYLSEMDERAAALKQMAEERGYVPPEERNNDSEENEDDEDRLDPEEASREIDERFEEAIVIIDKSGMGAAPVFTAEEREKMERVNKITLQEVESIDLETIVIKKTKKSLDSIAKRQPSIMTSEVVLPASGYKATMQGASTYEIVSLMTDASNAIIDAQTKWSIIHSKIVTTSLGVLSFNDFLRMTAAIEFETFVYGLLNATYPQDDKFPIRCTDCKKQFDYHYQVRSLLRAEKMSDKIKNTVAMIVDNSYTEEGAKQVHKTAPVNLVKRIRLPQSQYVVDLQVRSAYDLINNSIKELTKNEDEKLNQASLLSTAIKQFLIPNPDEPGTFAPFDSALDVTKTIYQLKDRDILVLTNKTEELLDDLTFEYGLKNVKCPHCGKYHQTMKFDIGSILFYQYQQAMNSKIG